MSKNKMNWKQYREWVEHMKTTEPWKKKKYLRGFLEIKEIEVKEPFSECSDCKKECKTHWGHIDYFGEISWCGKCLDCAYKYVKKLEEVEKLEENDYE